MKQTNKNNNKSTRSQQQQNKQVWDVKLTIHATTSTQQLFHQGHLNAPTVDEIAILLPSDDTITQKHINLIFLLFQVCYCQLQAARNYR